MSVVDDDESVRESLPDLLTEFGYAARAFASGAEFLASDVLDQTQCLILDIAMPGMSGPDLQSELAQRGLTFPVIFITATGDQALRSLLLANGAAGYLLKPFKESELRSALNAVLAQD